MNIENGAKTLERMGKEGNIQVPINLTTFTLEEIPDFEGIFGTDAFSIYVGIPHQGWMNGSLASEIFKAELMIDGVRDPTIIKKRHNLTPQEAAVFLEGSYKELQIDPWEFKPSDITGVAYKSWSDSDVDKTFFVETQERNGCLTYSLQVTNGNPDGWKFTPSKATEQDFDEPLQKEILRQATLLHYEVAPHTITGIVIMEGKVTNKNYGRVGPMIIDVYQGFPMAETQALGHAELIHAYIHDSLQDLTI
ncbi:MAG: hypothetical protein AABX14_00630 [Candidatus Aenigmatarchaeota archaeon]